MLAELWRRYPTQLRADLQRYFGLNVERMGRDFSCWQAAACAVSLPLGSSTHAAIDPRASYTREELFLHTLVNLLAKEHLPFPWEEAERQIADFEAVGLDEFKRWHAREWREE